MNEALGLQVLGQIMRWPDERAREEFRWLRLMARLKYDGYRDFQAGMRFIESFATWLQQFDQAERETAYDFVRRWLVYVGPAEMQRLVEQFYPRTVRDQIFRTVCAERRIPSYRILADADASGAAKRLRRQTLFMGLSDGARIDTVRHTNAGILTNEQLVLATQVDQDKWVDLVENLRADLDDPTAKFRLVYLIDDFTGTGTSLIRWSKEKKKWRGKLMRFHDSLQRASKALEGGALLAEDWQLCIHHYIASASAATSIRERLERATAEIDTSGWASATHVTYGTVLPDDLPIDAVPGRHESFLELTRKYYDPVLRTKHTEVGGATHVGLGYGGCALPLILDHNTPNNSVALLWAETSGSETPPAPAMRPLFGRRQRHG